VDAQAIALDPYPRAAVVVPDQYWPVYPDRVPILKVSWRERADAPSMRIPDVPDILAGLTFTPSFPDRVPREITPKWALDRGERIEVPAVPDILADLTFSTTYPDRSPQWRTPRWAQAVGEVEHAVAVFPIPDILASQTFWPSFPDRVATTETARRHTDATLAAWSVTAIHPLAWTAVYPDRVAPRALPRAAHPAEAAPPPGQGVVVAQTLAWEAVTPARVPVWRLLDPGGQPWIPDLETLGLVPCLHLAEDAATTTALTDETLTVTALLDGELVRTALIDEDLC